MVLLLGWAVASLGGLGVSFWIAQSVSGRVLFGLRQTGLDPQLGGLYIMPVQLAIFGATLGLAQWLVLRQYLPGVGWWPVATAIGALVATPLWIAISLPFRHLLSAVEAETYAVLTGCTAGFLIALGQVTVLRSKVGGSVVWLTAGFAGYGLGALFAMTLSSIFLVLPFELYNAAMGVIAGAVTGAALVYLISKRGLAIAAGERQGSRQPS